MESLIKFIKKEITVNSLDYLVLLTSGVLFLIFLRLFQGSRMINFMIISLFVATYIAWGMIHHHKNNTHHLKNLLEYIIIGFTIIFLLKIIVVF